MNSASSESASARHGEPVADIEFARAFSFLESGELASAEAAYRRVLQADPQHWDALHMLGIVLAQSGRAAEGLRCIQTVVDQGESSADVLNNLANIYKLTGQLEPALQHYRQAIALDGGQAQTRRNLMSCLVALGRSDAAVAECNALLASDPADGDAHNGLAAALWQLDRYEEALSHALRAVALRPDMAEAHSNLSSILCRLGRLDAALEHGRRALALAPEMVGAYRNTTMALLRLNCHEEALPLAQRAVAIEPTSADLRFVRAMVSLGMGRLEDGLADLEARWNVVAIRNRLGTIASPFPGPLADLAGKKVLLACEQGFGDTLLFFRYARELRRRGAQVTLAAQQPLLPLLRGHPDIDRLVGIDDPLPPSDIRGSLMSLPHALGTTLRTIPADVPYIFSTPDKVARWRQRLGTTRQLTIGLAWSGNARQTDDHLRSLSLDLLEPLLACGNFRWVSLQKEVRDADQAALRRMPSLCRFDSELKDFSDTAALMDCVDLVISVCTSAAHLAGSMGRPLWVMLPYHCYWIWFREREDSPWYPTARLFRQQTPGDWSLVVRRIAASLSGVRAGMAADRKSLVLD